MPTNNKSIQILRGNKSSLSNDLKRTILKSGQPFFDKNAKTLQIGNGTDNLDNAPYVTVKDSAIVESKLDTGSVTNAKIRDRAINDAKIADDAAIKGSKLADANNTSSPSGITTGKIENNAITPEKLQATGDFNAHSFSSNDDNTKEYANYEADRIVFKSTAKDSDGQVTLVPSIAVGQTVMLGLPSVDGTLATAEEIESGEIVAKTAQNATNAQKTDFSNAEWQQCLNKTVDNKDVYYFDIPEKGTYEIDFRPYGFSKQVSGLATLDYIYYPMKEVTVSSDIELMESSDGWVRINTAVLKIDGSEAVLYDRSATISLPNGTIGKQEKSIGFKYRRIR